MSDNPQTQQKLTDSEMERAHIAIEGYIERLYGTRQEELSIVDSPKFSEPNQA